MKADELVDVDLRTARNQRGYHGITVEWRHNLWPIIRRPRGLDTTESGPRYDDLNFAHAALKIISFSISDYQFTKIESGK